MARRLRLQFPGAIYHVMNRGDRREDIFRDDTDRERFIDTLAEACAKTAWQVHAFCLMRNHFHLVVETPQANLVAGMKWMLGTYTVRFNRRHALTGHLFSGRYRSQLVGGEGGYLRTACDYVHLNPVRAGIVTSEAKLASYRWSRVPAYLLAPASRPVWLRVDRLLCECGIPQDSPAGRREFESRLERLRRLDQGEDLKELRKSWCLGNDEFRRELLDQLSGVTRAYHYGTELREADEAHAQRIVADELSILGWAESDLRSRRKGAPEKLAIAKRLRRETTMTLAWIAERLAMGAKGYLTYLLYWENRRQAKPARTRRARAPRTETNRVRRLSAPKPEASRTKNTPIPTTDPMAVQFDTSFD